MRTLSKEYLDECFIYNPETGDLVWKVRPRAHFNSDRGYNIFNTAWAGRVAGSRRLSVTTIRVGGGLYKAHRLVWKMYYGTDPDAHIDHKNRNPNDNRIENLREATGGENQRNAGMKSTNKSGLKGVHFNRKTSKWRASTTVDRKSVYLGEYASRERAFEAYKAGIAVLHGAFACAGD
jgi:hypothetical protein